MTSDSPPLPASPERVWRDEAVLVLRRGARLPLRCVSCNGSTSGPSVSKTFRWHHPGLYILLLNPLIYAVAALALRKSVTVHLPLCSRHRTRRRGALLVRWCGGVASLALVATGVALDSVALALPGFYALAACLVYAAIAGHTVRVAGSDDRFVRLRGADLGYLAGLRGWNDYPEAGS